MHPWHTLQLSRSTLSAQAPAVPGVPPLIFRVYLYIAPTFTHERANCLCRHAPLLQHLLFACRHSKAILCPPCRQVNAPVERTPEEIRKEMERLQIVKKRR